MAETDLPVLQLLAAVLLHLPDGVEEEENEDRDENIEIVDELSLQTSGQARPQQLGPHPDGDDKINWSHSEVLSHLEDMKGTRRRRMIPISM